MNQKIIANHFDNMYQQEGAGFLGNEAIPAVKLIPDHISGGVALDIGGGAGRNALFLAQHGFAVDVVDVSEVGLQKLQDRANAAGLSVNSIHGDITELGIKKTYDVFVTAYVLHILPDKTARQLIDNMKANTSPGGIHVITSFTKDGDFFKKDRKKGLFYTERNELKQLYDDWEVISYTESKSNAVKKHPDGMPITNTVSVLLAKKK